MSRRAEANSTAAVLELRPIADSRPEDLARRRLLEHGASVLTDAELLGLVLPGSNTIQAAERLLGESGCLRTLCVQETTGLRAMPDMGAKRATTILAAVELGRRTLQMPDRKPRMTCSERVFEYLAPKLQGRRREEFHVLCLNSRNALLSDVKVAEGTVSTCPVDPREIFGAALAARATAIILAHNHPSGDPEPSAEDIDLTARISAGARLLGVQLIDHVVVGTTCVSLRARGMLRPG